MNEAITVGNILWLAGGFLGIGVILCGVLVLLHIVSEGYKH